MSENNVLIFGDSYSTFAGYNPDGYAVYYSSEETRPTDVRQVEETWWYQVIARTGAALERNDSWSGSTIGFTGYNGADCSHTSSFIFRLRRLVQEGYFNRHTIHTVYVFGGTNDTWSNAPLGLPKWDNIQEDDLFCVLPAICYFFKELKAVCPTAAIYCLINTELKKQIGETLQAACQKYGATTIHFDNIDKRDGHPTVHGMREIAEQVLQVVEAK